MEGVWIEQFCSKVIMRRTRQLFLPGLCLLAGLSAVALVYVGDHFLWHGFNRRSGYFGTEFMRSILYAINDPYAIHIVALIWFSYAAVTTYLCGWVIWRLFRQG